jgi:GGDEF domain-containing protein
MNGQLPHGSGQPQEQHLVAARGIDDFGSYALDPITGLVAFPSFQERFPRIFARELAAGRVVGIAIGDVDDLKGYVERSRAADDLMFGHLAGNTVMTQLGHESLRWFAATEAPGCLATFGGDEVILAMIGVAPHAFGRHVRRIGAALSAALPRTVSFAHATFSAADGPTRAVTATDYARALVLVDRALFAAKKRTARPQVLALRPRSLDNTSWSVARSSGKV